MKAMDTKTNSGPTVASKESGITKRVSKGLMRQALITSEYIVENTVGSRWMFAVPFANHTRLCSGGVCTLIKNATCGRYDNRGVPHEAHSECSHGIGEPFAERRN